MRLDLQMVGRFGNQAMQYLHARARAERDGLELRVPRWVGEKIFQIETTPEPDYRGQYLSGYFQNQHAAIYTASQVRQWFIFQPWVEELLGHLKPAPETIVAHYRRGDFHGYGYPLIALQAYYNACHEFKLDIDKLCFVLEEAPTKAVNLPDELSWLPDFYILSKASTIMRANSSFSWVAAVIGGGRVFSPRIDGLSGGCEHVCRFEPGNHCKLSDLEGFSDIELKP